MKAPEAFRSISEVATIVGVPQHTLRAWETRFPSVKPVKRPDGRRYYRPSDIATLVELRRRLSKTTSTGEAVSASRSDIAARLLGHRDALTSMRTRLASLVN